MDQLQNHYEKYAIQDGHTQSNISKCRYLKKSDE